LEQSRSLGDGQLAAFLETGDERLAARAALAIGRTKQPAGEALLAAYLSDARPAVRAMSVYGLGLLGRGARAADIAIASRSDGSSAVRIAALDALERYEAAGALRGGGEAVAALAIAGALHADADPLVRARAAVALSAFANGLMGDFASRQLASAMVVERERGVRWHIAWTLFRSYAIRAPRELLVQLLHDPDELVRIEAVRALGRVKNADAITALKPMLDDPSWRVQEQAAESILVLQGKALTDHWKAIPPTVHLPAIPPDALANLPALPRSAVQPAKPGIPSPLQALLVPTIDPQTARDMNNPAPGAHPRLRIVTTKGNLYVTLYPEWAPLTVANFLNLADRGYYDGNRWFRIVPDFVTQTGDPNDNGEGDAGYTIGAEENPVEQRQYVISMGMNYTDPPDAHAIRDSAGTQFYITLSPQLHLDRDFTVFGEVSGGADVLAHLIESDRMVRVERIADVDL
jgi:peptidyl-prolyl cis-trans isomerase B (cyclophilin B)